MAIESPAAEGTPAPLESGDQVSELAQAPAPLEEGVQDEVQGTGPTMGGTDSGQTTLQEAAEDSVDDDPEVQQATDGRLSPWVTRGLGIAAAVLAAVTFWLTYQPVSRRK